MLHFSWLSNLCTKIKSVFTKSKQIEEHYKCECNQEFDEEYMLKEQHNFCCDCSDLSDEADDKVIKELNRTRVKKVLKKTKKIKKGETK